VSSYTHRAQLMQRSDLTPLARLLALRILDMQGLSKGACLLTTATLADDLGVSKRQVLRASAALRDVGLLVSSERSAHRRIVVSAIAAGDTDVTPVVTLTSPPADGDGDTDVTPLVTSTSGGGDADVTSVVTLTSPRTREELERELEKERESLSGGSVTTPASFELSVVEMPTAPRRRSSEPGMQTKTGPAWHAYATAMELRHGVRPSWNKRAAGCLAQFIGVVGCDDAPHIAAWYVDHNDRWYVQQGHDLRYLNRDAAKLRMEWMRGQNITRAEASDAASVDERQARVAAARRLAGKG